jgi:hypothetical protein
MLAATLLPARGASAIDDLLKRANPSEAKE